MASGGLNPGICLDFRFFPVRTEKVAIFNGFQLRFTENPVCQGQNYGQHSYFLTVPNGTVASLRRSCPSRRSPTSDSIIRREVRPTNLLRMHSDIGLRDSCASLLYCVAYISLSILLWMVS